MPDELADPSRLLAVDESALDRGWLLHTRPPKVARTLLCRGCKRHQGRRRCEPTGQTVPCLSCDSTGLKGAQLPGQTRITGRLAVTVGVHPEVCDVLRFAGRGGWVDAMPSAAAPGSSAGG